MKRLLVGAAILVSACGGNSTSPSSTPPATATPTKIITVSGDLAFGAVNLGESSTRTFTIGNTGNTALTFTSLNAVGGSGATGYTAGPTSGSVPPGGTVTVTMRFAPTAAGFWSHVLTVVGDQTSGGAAINVSGTGINNTPLFTRSGHGNTVFDMPTSVRRVRIQGRWSGNNTSNFIVHIGGLSVVNEILRQSITYDGIHLTTGGVVEIVSSGDIDWTFTEVR